ncbi:hypothetical protein UFOVP116_100 [uncultured Caudovirales phage]|uniref:DUF4407 domain containing protein n=1 Tax=uncultured Caudovirales phage TaxID=2100421 RepID=A0A6J5L8I3_9CAUD|nr:hypothetical protein UFOVP116_100 [uncultured Caudovirales phage]
MILGYFVLFVAIITSAVSAYYSVSGLATIFSGAFWPIVIMGSTLELGKLTAALWLHKNWVRAELHYKLYLVPALCVLMLLTSMGIFGGLSKAHLEQAAPTGDLVEQIALYDEKIATERENIESAKRALKQMDEQVDQFLGRSEDVNGAARAVRVRKSQASERTTLSNAINEANTEITRLNALRTPLANKLRKVENEIGPIKYVAALIYGTESTDAHIIEKAVRWVIILIVIVFDPLAIVLILAGSRQIAWAKEDAARARKEKFAMAKSEANEEIFVRSIVKPMENTQQNSAIPKDLGEAKTNNVPQQVAGMKPMPVASTAFTMPIWTTTTQIQPVTDNATAEITEAASVPEIPETTHVYTDVQVKDILDDKALNEIVESVAQSIPDIEINQTPTTAAPKEEPNEVEDPAYFEAYGEPNEIEAGNWVHDILNYQDNSNNTPQEEIIAEETPLITEAEIEELINEALVIKEIEEVKFTTEVNTILGEEEYQSDIESTLMSIEEFEHARDMDSELAAAVESEIKSRDEKIETLSADMQTLHKRIAELEAKNSTYSMRLTELHEENLLLTGNPSNANFGTSYPLNAKKGDMFLRVDHKPSRLFKWNGTGWIEIDKTSTDTYAYDRRYLQYLINKINTGEYSLDELSQPEQDSISEMLIETTNG